MDVREQRLSEIQRHISNTNQHITQQIQLIENLERNGRDTTEAEAFLATLKQVAETLHAHLRIIFDKWTDS